MPTITSIPALQQELLDALAGMLAMHDDGVVALGIVRRARAAVAAAERAANRPQGARVSIHSRTGGRWQWAGDGRLDGNRIVDCAADIGDAVYGSLEGAVVYDAATGAPEPREYVREVEGTEWCLTVHGDGA